MEITTATREGATILTITGRVDTATAPALEREINHQIEQGNRKILLNFSGISYISSGGLRVLLTTAKKLRNPKDRLGLCCLSAEVHKVLKLAGFTSIFPSAQTKEKPLPGGNDTLVPLIW